ncbi:MAG: class I SAM-dependent RNA methyltransferase [Acidimicrobiia bacterium]|nr:class I SAM-dependent RNA methyltransferase [Acidimicrobiia bacterium]
MLELHPHDIAHGGEAVARKDGKAHFVAGALPGEVVTATITEDRGSWARAALVSVVEASDERRQPPCPHAATCGGCQWQFADEAAQRRWKRDTVASQLAHIGRIDNPIVHDTVAPSASLGYRNRMDFHVVDGRPALYRSRSHDLVPLDVCLLLVEPLRTVFDSLGDLTGVERFVLRGSDRTGDILMIVEGEVPASILDLGIPILHRQPGGLTAVAGEPALRDEVAGVRFEIPFDGFFQNNTDGAEALVALVADVLDLDGTETMLDAYGGVGLFGATVGRRAVRVLGIESSAPAAAFARRNLAGAGVDHRIITGSVTRDIEQLDEYWDVVVVDPPRKGLTERGVEAVTSTMPTRVAYVSCDPASFARDARTFEELGYRFVEATPVDMFPQTYHVEIVGRFDRIPFEDDDGGR